MASDSPSKPASSSTSEPDERTPLIQHDVAPKQTYPRSLILRVLFTSFLVSVSFGVTQVPIIYIFRLMTCDEYYKTHPDIGLPDRCRHPAIEAGTARAIALLGASTTFIGVINLFVTGWAIKSFGIKKALIVSIFWPSIRLLVQNVGVEYGAGLGILIIQLSQILTIVGGPAGYLLALNAYSTEIVEPAERTGLLGRLQGCAMFGTSLGFLAGGLLGDMFSIKMPFRVTLVMFLFSSIWAFLALPDVGMLDRAQQAKASKSLSAFFGPIKMFAPVKWRLKDGRVRKEYGLLLLGVGMFLGVLATSYIPTLLQMYGTDVFDFGTSENGWLISLNSAIRGIFLTFAFPPIIKYGRQWLQKMQKEPPQADETESLLAPNIQIDADQIAPAAAQDGEPEPIKPPRVAEQETYAFDLFFTKWSLILDGVLTGFATFLTEGWQMYLIAAVIPLASGTGSAAKGTVLQMCPPDQRTDALSAISLLELVARLSTTAVFGVIFSAFADIGKTWLIFPCNAAIAGVGFVVLLFAHFPPDGAHRYVAEDDTDSTA